ncbi:hypothetical protein [Streptomyces sp. NPDC006855]|uniref:8-oxoguanine DNA glycosylase OGG fold protein n=1 Tax=Streptomyces sp. NPDC006855 TaxID=3364765 RepID=UPI0036C7C69C
MPGIVPGASDSWLRSHEGAAIGQHFGQQLAILSASRTGKSMRIWVGAYLATVSRVCEDGHRPGIRLVGNVTRQDRANAVDRVIATCPLSDADVRALGRWWSVNASVYADGTPGAHAVRYTPGRWAQITPWPAALASVLGDGDAALSRAEVALAVSDALGREAFREALVATYVWGKGKRGSPGGSGPATLAKILAFDGLDTALASAVVALSEHGSQAAYAALHRRVPWLGPSFLTKFLYFTGTALPPADGFRPLILDRVVLSPPADGRRSGPGWRPRPGRLDSRLGVVGRKLVAPPVRGLPLLHARCRPPAGAGRPVHRPTCSNARCSPPHGSRPADTPGTGGGRRRARCAAPGAVSASSLE